MRTLAASAYRVVPGRAFGTPKEIWGFRVPIRKSSPEAAATRFLEANRQRFGLDGVHYSGEPRVLRSLGATHVILQQAHRGVRVHRAYVTVHMGKDGGIYLVKNRAVPAQHLPERFGARLADAEAERRACAAVRSTAARARSVEPLWYWKGDALVPALRVRVFRDRPRREWVVHLDAVKGKVLEQRDNLAKATGRARVFDPSPVAALRGARPLLDGARVLRPPARAYVEVELVDLDGDGFLDGLRVTTGPTPDRVRRPDGDFLFHAHEPGFAEAMAYHHIDAALRRLEEMGYAGPRAIFTKPIPVNVRASGEDNSWYSPQEKLICFGTGDVPDAQDAETILHELGHAVQDAICPDFGASQEAAAMGEGFGDYLAASSFEEKKPPALRAAVMLWDGILYGGEGAAPGVRRLDEPLTYESFDHAEDADEHDNGPIWSSTLWDVRAAVGREVADRIIVESHFQLDGYTTFARGARAVLDADRNLYGGEHQDELVRIFHRRGIAPVV